MFHTGLGMYSPSPQPRDTPAPSQTRAAAGVPCGITLGSVQRKQVMEGATGLEWGLVHGMDGFWKLPDPRQPPMILCASTLCVPFFFWEPNSGTTLGRPSSESLHEP